MNKIEEAVKILLALVLVVASLYTSVKYAQCGEKKVVIPNQINLVLGAIGLVFGICSCCVSKLSKFEFGTAVILPGIAIVVDCFIMMSVDCKLSDGTELKRDAVVISELVVGALMAVVGMWDLHRRTFKLRKI